jgi:hypothetical protein
MLLAAHRFAPSLRASGDVLVTPPTGCGPVDLRAVFDLVAEGECGKWWTLSAANKRAMAAASLARLYPATAWTAADAQNVVDTFDARCPAPAPPMDGGTAGPRKAKAVPTTALLPRRWY